MYTESCARYLDCMPHPGPKVIADVKELRALAHPVRLRLLKELYRVGEANVSSLAEAIDVPVNHVSFHLGQLAKYDFIEPAPERARDSRDRWWRPAYEQGLDWDVVLDSSAASLARSSLSESIDRSIREITEYFRTAIQELPTWPEGSFAHDLHLRLTSEEAARFDREYLEFCARWSSATRDRGPQDKMLTVYAFGLIEDR